MTHSYFRFALIFAFALPLDVRAACEDWVARVVSAEGRVEVREDSAQVWQPATADQQLCRKDMIRTGDKSRAMLVLYNQTYVRLDQKTELRFEEENQTSRSWLELLRGALYSISRVPNSLEIRTPYVNAAIKGTEFLVTATDQQSRVSVFEGEVDVSNAAGSLQLPTGSAAVARAGMAPVAVLSVPLKDAVEWALYYPSVIDQASYQAAGVPAGIRQAVALHVAGQHLPALDMLGQQPGVAQQPDYLVLKADMLLALGRVDEARLALGQAEGLAPGAAEVDALRSIIQLTKGDTATALALAEEAISKSPGSAMGWLVQSYAWQARFDLEKAIESVRRVLELQPEHARAWARLAELRLSMGEIDLALGAADRAIRLAPQLAHALSLKGYAELMLLDADVAQQVFNDALAMESNAPVSRLGLGLTLIRQGHLAEGREQLEIAAVMNPRDSLVRSYLGKAYYEERREPLAAKELAMAKQLDPSDPTPWFYDAILQQTVNRHHDALHSLEQAIALNDNRAVYRSRLLLDRDLASRVVSLSRIHAELGFEQTAVNQSSQSLDQDPTNYSAHRFLFDSYRNRDRHEAARVSEHLQTQLLQPINMNPVQPELTVTDLNIVSGLSSSELGFNEFTPLFERNGVQFTGGGLAGSNETVGDQVVISGVHDRLSYSLGQFYYETEGYRSNNEQRHKVLNLFAQYAITSQLDVQLEYRRRKSEEGDLRLNFDPNDFSRTLDRELEQETPRLGLHYRPTLNSDIIASFSYSDRQEDVDDKGIEVASRQHGFDSQLRYTWTGEKFNVTLGGGHTDYDGRLKQDIVLNPGIPFIYVDEQEGVSGEQNNAYLYANLRLPRALVWTLGVSLQTYRDSVDDVINYDRVLPKFGLQWDVYDGIRLRMAAFKTVKRPEIFQETLEPTQIAAFNQVFDDFNGTISKQYGFAIDLKPNSEFFAGAEWMRRDLDVPRVFGLPVLVGVVPSAAGLRLDYDSNNFASFEQQREDHFRLYSYWTPLEDWSFSVELRRKRFRRSPATQSGIVAAGNIPIEVKTTEIPLEARYFAANGFFALFRATHVRQRVERPPISSYDKGKENFFILDASAGYRLPKRHGLIALDFSNILDEEFLYQDSNIQNSDPTDPDYIPDQLVQMRLTLNF